jgi:acetate kinase
VATTPHTLRCRTFRTSRSSTPRSTKRCRLPFQLYKKHHLRKYGFHGTSHRFVTFRGCQILDWQREDKKLISVHLGNGCSLAAVDHAKSIDTSMGFTPLEGLIMGTRSGDMDPAIVPWLMAMEELTLHQVNTMLNKHSGLYGVSGVSSDMREIIEARSRGRMRADVAFRMFCYRIKKYIAGYAAAMGGVDAVFFTGGIGQRSPEVREGALEGLEFMGIELDRDRNAAATGDEAEITTDASRSKVLAIPTNEEKTIARDVIRVLNGIMPEFTPPETFT